MSSKKRIFGGFMMAAAATTAIGLALVGTPSTGADFTASANGSTQTQTGTLTVELGTPGNLSGTFHLAYNNMKPGDVQGQQFVVKNTGSIVADVSLTNRNQGGANQGNLTGHSYEQLSAAVQGYSGYVTSNVGLNANLGTLNPGQSRTYTLLMQLDHSAGNEWQGVTINSGVVITLNQHN